MRSGRKPRARFHASWSPAARLRNRTTGLRLLAVLGAVLAVLLTGGTVYATSFISSLPDVRGLDATLLKGDTVILARDGTTVLADIGVGQGAIGEGGDRRHTVTLKDISPRMQDATVSVEDRTFWSNSGFDTEAIFRTAANNFKAGGIAGGGSTITQQLAKRMFLSPAQSLDRKMKELVLAYQLSQTYSKKQILELYLNETYYGDEQYGVQAAAQSYFHKDAKSIDLAQAAMLAGLPQAPDAYSPTLHLPAAKARQKEVLDAMVRDGKITPQDATAAYNEQFPIYGASTNYKAPQFVTYVLNELRSLGFKPGQQQLVVKTTLDFGKQQIGEQVVRENRDANASKDPPAVDNGKLVPGQLSSSLVSMDPKTGQILAYVGSPNFTEHGGEFDYVSGVPINPGSSLKPFTYAAAIRDRKITMDTPIADGPSPYVVNVPGQGPWKVYNYDKATHGNPPARVALASSLNIPAVKVELAEGVAQVVDMQRSVGLRPRLGEVGKYTTEDPNTSFGPSLTLGGYPITLLEEVGAFGVLANLGAYHRPEAILQVTDVKGQLLYQADPNKGARQVMDPNVAFIIDAILNDDNNRAPVFGHNSPLHLPDRNSAAKTGTTEDHHDGVTVGFTPDLVTGVWIGDIISINHHMVGNRADAVFVAAPAWNKFMMQALKGVPDKWLKAPPGVRQRGSSYFLPDTLKVEHLDGDNPNPSPSPNAENGIPPDPGTGPQRKACRVPLPIICPTP
jgi:membrane peptidoglycan carboxypeptidase